MFSSSMAASFSKPVDEQPADPLDVSAMTRDQRDALKQRIVAQHSELVDEFTR